MGKGLENRLFAHRIKLDPGERQLMISFLGGGLAAYDLTGNPIWFMESNGYRAPELYIGDTAIIADYPGNNENKSRHRVASYHYDGTLRWEYEVESFPGEVKHGRDGNVYIRASSTEIEDTEELIIFQQ